ncbi:MAG: hypothetical protein ABIJ18_00475 [archaeon]
MSISQKPKVLVGCPTCNIYEYCLEEYTNRVNELSYDNYDVLLVDNSKDEYKVDLPVVKDEYVEPAVKRIVNSRNILRKKMLDEGYDYFLSLEQDVIPPKDVIERLLGYGKKVVSGVVFSRIGGKILPLVWKENNEEIEFYQPEEMEPSRLERVRSVSMGCLLIHKSVLEDIEFRYEKDKKCFDDMFFSNDLYDRKIGVYIDTGLKCKHRIIGRSWKDIQKF